MDLFICRFSIYERLSDPKNMESMLIPPNLRGVKLAHKLLIANAVPKNGLNIAIANYVP